MPKLLCHQVMQGSIGATVTLSPILSGPLLRAALTDTAVDYPPLFCPPD
jgi:hypothetical protein